EVAQTPRAVHLLEVDPQDERFSLYDGRAHPQQQHPLVPVPPQPLDVQPAMIGQVPQRLPQLRQVLNDPSSDSGKHLRLEPVVVTERDPQEAVPRRGFLATLALLAVTPFPPPQTE